MSEPAPPAAPRRLFDWRILPLLALTAAILWLLVTKLASAESFLAAIRGARWELLPAAVGLVVLNLFLGVYRWRLVLVAMGHRVPYRECLLAVLSTWPLALLIPARAGDVLRALAIRAHVPVLEGMGSVVAEKVVDVQSLCLLSLAGTLATGLYEWSVAPAVMLVGLWLAVALLVRLHVGGGGLAARLGRLGEKLDRLSLALVALVRAPRPGLGVVITSLLAWVIAVALVDVLLAAVSTEVPLGATAALWPLAVFAGMLPVSVAGMGTRDGAFVYALVASGHAVEEGPVLAATLGYSLVATWLLAVVGLPFAVRFAASVTRRPS